MGFDVLALLHDAEDEEGGGLRAVLHAAPGDQHGPDLAEGARQCEGHAVQQGLSGLIGLVQKGTGLQVGLALKQPGDRRAKREGGAQREQNESQEELDYKAVGGGKTKSSLQARTVNLELSLLSPKFTADMG